MVGVCLVSKDGKLLCIKEVSDDYRYIEYDWKETSKNKILKWILIDILTNNIFIFLGI